MLHHTCPTTFVSAFIVTLDTIWMKEVQSSDMLHVCVIISMFKGSEYHQHKTAVQKLFPFNACSYIQCITHANRAPTFWRGKCQSQSCAFTLGVMWTEMMNAWYYGPKDHNTNQHTTTSIIKTPVQHTECFTLLWSYQNHWMSEETSELQLESH